MRLDVRSELETSLRNGRTARNMLKNIEINPTIRGNLVALE
jgi:hypothetical protein